MKINFEKVAGKIQDFFDKENVKKIIATMEAFQDEIVEGIDRLSQKVKDNTDVPCEMIFIEKLDKEIIKQTKMENAMFLAMLNGGRNAKDKLEIYLQYMDGNKQALDSNKVICVRCDMLATTLKDAFGDKELLIVKL